MLYGTFSIFLHDSGTGKSCYYMMTRLLCTLKRLVVLHKSHNKAQNKS